MEESKSTVKALLKIIYLVAYQIRVGCHSLALIMRKRFTANFNFFISELPKITEMVTEFETLAEDGSIPMGMGIAQLLCIIVVIIVR